ncbi:hypothetical protein CEUSTIGMA_g13109.t1 [Chlamydomonas eustigma]|uniref:Uncharacterized protein n=1 Tax=Chlamydomonas eustigma TaxID=1157962 RepID=A0A250XRQ7_9CHLO|nr:hypothetical protein CEUSTIGMA_g13109.t1 [Chlamydomonas eustigma]|eukprot:GAX85693.1 hypothetical protein CEUSTIGMA_g13109.t1 [Chlamydomonas eustigma]
MLFNFGHREDAKQDGRRTSRSGRDRHEERVRDDESPPSLLDTKRDTRSKEFASRLSSEVHTEGGRHAVQRLEKDAEPGPNLQPHQEDSCIQKGHGRSSGGHPYAQGRTEHVEQSSRTREHAGSAAVREGFLNQARGREDTRHYRMNDTKHGVDRLGQRLHHDSFNRQQKAKNQNLEANKGTQPRWAADDERVRNANLLSHNHTEVLQDGRLGHSLIDPSLGFNLTRDRGSSGGRPSSARFGEHDDRDRGIQYESGRRVERWGETWESQRGNVQAMGVQRRHHHMRYKTSRYEPYPYSGGASDVATISAAKSPAAPKTNNPEGRWGHDLFQAEMAGEGEQT